MRDSVVDHYCKACGCAEGVCPAGVYRTVVRLAASARAVSFAKESGPSFSFPLTHKPLLCSGATLAFMSLICCTVAHPREILEDPFRN